MKLEEIEQIALRITDLAIAELVSSMGRKGKVVESETEASLRRGIYEITRQGLNEHYGEEVLMPKGPHWVISVGNPSNFTCLRCGETFRPPLPLSITGLVGMISSFGAMHQNCKEPVIVDSLQSNI